MNEILSVMSHFYILSIIIFTLKLAHGNIGGIGGHDLFASNMELKILWENDIGFVKLIESIKEKWKDGPKSFDM